MTASVEIVLLIVCLIGSAFYSGIETGVVSVNRLRLHHLVRRKKRGADIIQHFIDHPDHLLGTTLVGTNTCNVIVSVISASLAVQWAGAHGMWMAGVLTTLILLVAGEYLPKAWFRSYPAYRVLPFARALKVSDFVFYPLSRTVTFLARLIIPSSSIRDDTLQPFITREEIAHLTHEGEKTGQLTSAERRMILGVLELTRKTVGTIMIPRDKMVFCKDTTPTDELIDLARYRKLSRLPVFNEDERKFVGVVHILDILGDTRKRGKTARDYMRSIQWVDENTPADKILPRMRLSRQPMALVRNSRDETVGLATIEDLLEEIVGQM